MTRSGRYGRSSPSTPARLAMARAASGASTAVSQRVGSSWPSASRSARSSASAVVLADHQHVNPAAGFAPDRLQVHFFQNAPDPCERDLAGHRLQILHGAWYAVTHPVHQEPFRPCTSHDFPAGATRQAGRRIEKLERLSALLGGPDIYIKRDDLLGLAGGGNKTRKLEFLVADALAQGADTLITCGAVQSNHCRLTLAAAAKEGLKCRLVLEERVRGQLQGRRQRQQLPVPAAGRRDGDGGPAGVDLAAEMQKVADEVAALGRKAYVIPGGGSNALGALGYVACAEEILAQTHDLGLRLDHIVCASGSTGTHAGLICGLVGNNSHIPLTGINVRRTRAGAGAERPQAGAGNGRAAGDSRAASRGRRSPRSATGWARATRCRRPRWSTPCGCWRRSRASCSTRCIPARPWRV